MNRTCFVLLLGWSAALLSLGVWGTDLLPHSQPADHAGGNAFSHPGYVFAPCAAKAAPAPTPPPSTIKAVCTTKPCKPSSRPQDPSEKNTDCQAPCAAADTLVLGQS
jgi:hypothetical protein